MEKPLKRARGTEERESSSKAASAPVLGQGTFGCVSLQKRCPAAGDNQVSKHLHSFNSAHTEFIGAKLMALVDPRGEAHCRLLATCEVPAAVCAAEAVPGSAEPLCCAPYVLQYEYGGAALSGLFARGCLTALFLWHVARDLFQALDRLHSHNLVHGDVKAANVALSDADGATPRVRLLDFGMTTVATYWAEQCLAKSEIMSVYYPPEFTELKDRAKFLKSCQRHCGQDSLLGHTRFYKQAILHDDAYVAQFLSLRPKSMTPFQSEMFMAGLLLDTLLSKVSVTSWHAEAMVRVENATVACLQLDPALRCPDARSGMCVLTGVPAPPPLPRRHIFRNDGGGAALFAEFMDDNVLGAVEERLEFGAGMLNSFKQAAEVLARAPVTGAVLQAACFDAVTSRYPEVAADVQAARSGKMSLEELGRCMRQHYSNYLARFRNAMAFILQHCRQVLTVVSRTLCEQSAPIKVAIQASSGRLNRMCRETDGHLVAHGGVGLLSRGSAATAGDMPKPASAGGARRRSSRRAAR